MKYSELSSVYKQLESTSKRLEKTYHIAKLLHETRLEELNRIILLLQGRVFQPWDPREIGMASRLVLKAISISTGHSAKDIENRWAKTGDLGVVAEELCKKKKQATLFSSELTVKKVFDNIEKLASLEGQGSVDKKVGLVAELLSSAKPIDAKYIIRSVLQDLRVGVAEGTLRDAIVWAYLPKVKGVFIRCESCSALVPQTASCLKCGAKINKKYKPSEKGSDVLAISRLEELKDKDLTKYSIIITNDDKDGKIAREAYNHLVESVQEAYDLANDFSVVAEKLKKSGLKALKVISLESGRPVKVMLAQKVADIEEGFKKVGLPAEAEYKYDGFRMQIHKNKKGRITIFTRKLENVTTQFPEVVKNVKKNVRAASFIIDSEAVGYDRKTGKYTPFQAVSQRIKRKYSVEALAKELPIEVNVFDIILHNGKNLIKEPFSTRRKLIEKIVSPVKKHLIIAKNIVSKDKKTVEDFYKEALKIGNEGIMLKSLEAPYKPGSRVGYMVKLKPVMDTLDLVITAAEWGEGKRAKWLSSFTVACSDNGSIVDMGKVGTGIKEKETQEEGAVTFEHLTELLKPLITLEKGKSVKVRPNIVVEIKYEEIQKSPTYGSGYALRFPRLVAVRPDREVEDIASIETVKKLFEGQKK